MVIILIPFVTIDLFNSLIRFILNGSHSKYNYIRSRMNIAKSKNRKEINEDYFLFKYFVEYLIRNDQYLLLMLIESNSNSIDSDLLTNIWNEFKIKVKSQDT